MNGDTSMSGDPSMSTDSSLPGDSPMPAESNPGAGVDHPAAVAGENPAEGAGAPAPAGAADPVSELEEKLASLKAEHEALSGQYMRLAADFDNFRKRQSRDSDDLRLQITCSTLGEILPVVDNFDRARQQLNPLHRSYQGLYKQLVDVFKQLGVSPMRVEGEPFDPSLHEAVLREPSDAHPEDVVIEELQRGYHLNGRVLRHALVKVSMGPGPADSGEGAPAGPGAPEEHNG
jgi:molecular chaperone GrpE